MGAGINDTVHVSPQERPHSTRGVPDVPDDIDFFMEHLNDPNYDLTNRSRTSVVSTQIIDRRFQEHLPPLTAMRIVAGSAADLHVAKLGAEQMGGALEQSFPLFRVATETGFLDGKADQHLLG